MITWNVFIYFAVPSVLCAVVASILALRGSNKSAVSFSVASIAILAVFIGCMWGSMHRPPLRTMGETRLWYSFFAGISGLFTYLRWRYKWILSFSTLLSTVFIVLNIFKPEIHDQTLMPALQSGWFIPHVTVYMFSYSLLGCAFMIALFTLFRHKGNSENIFLSADTLIYIGTAFLTLGMLSGAIWAKQAWGHFWNWDSKETWALITWLVYLLYMHLRLYRKGGTYVWCFLIIFAFACLQMCWWGINFLPFAHESLHVY